MVSQRPPRAAVRAAVRACLADLQPGARVVVALSGGADSLALTAATVRVSAELGLLCEAVVVDHQIQPGSARVAAGARDQALILGCPHARVIRVDVPRGPGSGGVEAAARTARYRALDSVAAGDTSGGSCPPAAAVLLGHTRDDQAETVLLGLARGSGTRSLAGMAPVSGHYRRPLLGLSREVVHEAARAQAQADPRLEPWRDPHNADPSFARVRVRSEVLPKLEAALGPGIGAALARTAELARQDADALDDWAQRVWASAAPGIVDQPDAAQPGVVARLAVSALHDDRGLLPPAVVARVLRLFLARCGCPSGTLTAGHVWAVAALLDEPQSRAEVALPGGRRARREAGALVVRT